MALKFTPPDMILVFVGLEILLHYLFPIKQIATSPYNYLGILLIILGAIPNFWIYFHFKKRNTTTKIYENPKVLVTSGLFRISRNPNYLGMAVLLLGIALLLGSLITFIFPILFIILTNIFVIKKEEKNLEKTFGKRYLEYKNRVRRWI
jgi:protein-S-isoprenylcysteine O-methyltransferase Ste14